MSNAWAAFTPWAWLAGGVLAASAPAPAVSAPAAEQPALHYRAVTYAFEVPYPRDDDHAPAKRHRVEWVYPVFEPARDPATRALNGWVRLQSLRALLPEDTPLWRAAARLKDREIVARAPADRGLVDAGIASATVHVEAAAGRYRSFTVLQASVREREGDDDGSGIDHDLYDMRTGRTVDIADLFVADDRGALEALFQAYYASADFTCRSERHFDWAKAWLAGEQRIGLWFPLGYREDPRCSDVLLDDPAMTRLLRTPGDLAPEFRLVRD
ncbi:MAG: hypothetical protein ACJ8IK_30055 [Burkholderiaceae bacterium]